MEFSESEDEDDKHMIKNAAQYLQFKPEEGKGSKKNWNIQQLTGKLLTAVFKDYLIYDDIFEFVQCYWPQCESNKYIIKYAKY